MGSPFRGAFHRRCSPGLWLTRPPARLSCRQLFLSGPLLRCCLLRRALLRHCLLRAAFRRRSLNGNPLPSLADGPCRWLGRGRRHGDGFFNSGRRRSFIEMCDDFRRVNVGHTKHGGVANSAGRPTHNDVAAVAEASAGEKIGGTSERVRGAAHCQRNPVYARHALADGKDFIQHRSLFVRCSGDSHQVALTSWPSNRGNGEPAHPPIADRSSRLRRSGSPGCRSPRRPAIVSPSPKTRGRRDGVNPGCRSSDQLIDSAAPQNVAAWAAAVLAPCARSVTGPRRTTVRAAARSPESARNQTLEVALPRADHEHVDDAAADAGPGRRAWLSD